MRRLPLVFLSGFAFSISVVGFATPAAAQMNDIWRAGAHVNVVGDNHENISAAGAIVTVRGTVRNDIRAAGAEVDVDAVSGSDAWIAGAVVAVKGEAKRNMYVAGARVSVDARVGEKLSVAGARVVIGPQTEVSGPTRVAGADVIFSGTSKGPTEIYGDSIQINGRIAGDARVWGRNITVGRNAVIDGNIRFETFGEPLIEEGAKISGQQTVTLPQPRRVEPERIITAIGGLILFAVGAGFLLGLILLAGARGFVERSVDAMRNAPGRSALIGLGVFVLLPILAVVLMATVIGIPIGLLTLLAFPLLVFVGAVLAAIGLGDLLFNRRREPTSFGGKLLYLLLGLVILVAVGMIPFVGGLTWLAALLIGLGGLWQAVRGRPAAVAYTPAPTTT